MLSPAPSARAALAAVLVAYSASQLSIPVSRLAGFMIPPPLHAVAGLFMVAMVASIALMVHRAYSVLVLAGGFAIGLLVEVAGVATGLPFGRYEYSPTAAPRVLGLIPVAVPVYWLGVTYLAHVVSLSARPGGRAVDIASRVALVAVLSVSWDLVADPLMTSVGMWRWLEEGVYYGAPLSNFAGWAVTSSVLALYYELIPRAAGWAARGAGPLALVSYNVSVVSITLGSYSLGLTLPSAIGVAEALALALALRPLRNRASPP